MKRFYILLAVAFIGFIGNAQIVNIPDANFKAQLLATNPGAGLAYNAAGNAISVDANHDGNIQVSEAQQVSTLFIENIAFPISDLTGLGSFVNLKKLYCDNNHLTTIDLSNLTILEYLDCGANQINALNITSNLNLKYLDCSANQLTTLNVSNHPLLEEINVGGNQLPSMDVTSLANLKVLGFQYNPVTSIDVTHNLNLRELYLYYCPNITSVDLSNNSLLEIANLRNCNLASLDITHNPNLNTIIAHSNPISTLDVSHNLNLIALAAGTSQITSFDLSHNLALQTLVISGDNITTLDLSNNVNLSTATLKNMQLTTLDVSHNPLLGDNLLVNNNPLLESLNIKNGISIQNAASNNFSNCPNLRYICADDGEIGLVESQITANGFPDCHVNTYCSFVPGGTFYTVQGKYRHDSNNNGCDASDIEVPYLRTNIVSGITAGSTFSNIMGDYLANVPAGTTTVTPILENPSYFTISPSTVSVSFPATASPYTQDFCLSTNGTHNDLEVTLLPFGQARPGYDAIYKIIYKNKGTTTQSGTVSLNFADSIEDFVASTPNLDSQSANTLSWNFSNLLPFEQREITVTLNLNSSTETPPVNAGNGIIYTANITGTVDETPNDDTSVLNQTVVNSFDPNDKTCAEGSNLPVSEVGKYLHYIIRFENNGTANAQNIVVKDVIDTAKLDVNTLIPLSGSSAFETKISSGNKVEFIFQNINLPFDDANNDGYVAFKIKSLPTLTEGNVINNSANIYFDYNAPIVTNTNSVTVFNPLANPDFEFGTVFSLSPVPAKNSLTITTKQDVAMTSVSIYNALGQLIQVSTNPSETIDVSGLKTGSYFIKIVSDKGTSDSKFIKE